MLTKVPSVLRHQVDSAAMKATISHARNLQFRLSVLSNITLSSLLLYLIAHPSNRPLSSKGGPRHDTSAIPRREDWLLEETPAFCGALKHFPQPRDPQCKHKKSNVSCDSTQPQFFSQDGEDYYLYTRHFANLNRPGVYVDIAANDAMQISNTYFMDRCLGWHGICAEANGKYFENLFRKRSCLLVPTCISDTDGSVVRFGMRSASGGIVDTYKGDKEVLEKGPIHKLRCTTLEKIFTRVGLTQIDYLSLDVEGHELMVLKGIDWEAVHISVITVELSSRNRQQIVTFLHEKGFRSIDSGTQEVKGMKGFHMNDPVFVHKSQAFGSPV